MYEVMIFVTGALIGGFVTYKFNEHLWTLALKALAREVPKSMQPALVMAIDRAKDRVGEKSDGA